MQAYMAMFYETLFGFGALFVLTKVLGKTQISQLTPFDFISALILGELVGNALFDKNAGIPEIGFVIALWGGLLYLTEIITNRFKRTRLFLEGSPDIVIYRGKLMNDVMKKNNLDINQLQSLLRAKDVFSLRDVEFAFMETNGSVSVLKKSDMQTPTRQDMKLSPQEVNLAVTLVTNGEIIYDNLKEKNLTEEWLMEELREQGYDKVEDVSHAEYEKGKELFILPFINRNHEKFHKN
ncbi:YetF domain-containing protein [Virgibacillus sediminis]|uniref:YetF domain-containing protein n=1 Tax=Virgibacillus sediminis TaxID=202260 RepID=A0ABV7AAA9_9BACI